MAAAVIRGGRNMRVVLERIAKGTSKAKALHVGYLGGEGQNHKGSNYPGSSTPVALVAYLMEMGVPSQHVPARPTITPVTQRGKKHWGKSLGAALVATNYDANKAFALMGEMITGEIRQAIIDLEAPPLSQVTLIMRMLRGPQGVRPGSRRMLWRAISMAQQGKVAVGVSNKPLVYSGFLLDSVDYGIV